MKIQTMHLKSFLVVICLLCCAGIAQSEEINTGAGSVKDLKAPAISLNLEEAINLALQANRNISMSRFSVESRQLSLNSAQSEFALKFVPAANLDLSGGDSESDQSVSLGLSLRKKLESGTYVSVSPAITRADSQYDSEITFSLAQPLLRGFGKEVNLDSLRSAEYSSRAADRSFYITRINTVLETVSTVYQVILQKELIRLNESLVSRLRSYVEAARIKEKIGLSTAMDVYRAEISLSDAEDSLTLASEGYEDAIDNLKIILSLPLQTELDIFAPLKFEIVRIDLKEAEKIALKNRIDLEQAKDEVKETQRRKSIAKHNILPELNLIFGYTRYGSSDDFGRGAALNEDIWGVRLETSTDLYRTVEKTVYKQSVIDVQAVRLNSELLHDEIRRDVRKQLTALKKGVKRIENRKDQIKQAEGKMALAKVKFARGMANNFDLIEAVTELQRATSDLLSVNIDYIIGTYNIRAILGTLIER